ncbi:MAG: hypothetical protein JWM95_1240 [Gemmatimonadetes bacterium]|nr:hypothetical protein [Gemmatimonadota bacterium]
MRGEMVDATKRLIEHSRHSLPPRCQLASASAIELVRAAESRGE